MRWLLLPLLVIGLSSLAGGETPPPSRSGRIELEVLTRAQGLRDGVGERLRPSFPATALRLVLDGPDARQDLLWLLEHAQLGGKVYALIGLRLVDRAAFEARLGEWLASDVEVEVRRGYDTTRVRVRDLLRRSAAERAAGAEDIEGGALAERVGRHRGWGRPERDLDLAAAVREAERWTACLSEPGVDPSEVGGELAELGAAGFDVALRLCGSRRAEERRVAAEVLAEQGVASCGPRAGEAVRALTGLLGDADAQARVGAARACMAYGPWAAPAAAALRAAAAGCPAETRDELEVDFAEYLVYAVSALARPEELEALLGCRSPHVRRMAVEELGDLRDHAPNARLLVRAACLDPDAEVRDAAYYAARKRLAVVPGAKIPAWWLPWGIATELGGLLALGCAWLLLAHRLPRAAPAGRLARGLRFLVALAVPLGATLALGQLLRERAGPLLEPLPGLPFSVLRPLDSVVLTCGALWALGALWAIQRPDAEDPGPSAADGEPSPTP